MNFVRSTHRTMTVAGIGTINVFTVNTKGQHLPGLVRKLAPASPKSTDGSDFQTTLEMVFSQGCDLVVNASGWTSDWETRGPNIKDGIARGELSTRHPQDNAAVAYCEDGKLRYYEAALGHTIANMLNDGAVHSWSWGPKVIENGAIYNYMASGGWGALNRTSKSARTVLAQTYGGDLVIYQAYGVSGDSGATIDEIATALTSENLRIAVVLDGGGSTQSAWNGRIAHVSSDATSRKLPDAIGFMATPANIMRIPATQLPVRAPYTGTLECSLVDGRVTIVGLLNGSTGSPGSSQITNANTLPHYVRHPKPSGIGRAGGGKTLVPVIRSGVMYASNGYTDGVNNLDLYMEFDATHGMA